MKSSRPTAQFPKSSSVGERDWGKEILLVHSEGNFTMKKLLIKKGFSGGLQYHRKKDEAAYIISGILLVTYENEAGELVKKELREGNWLHFPKGSIHQETAISDVEIAYYDIDEKVYVKKVYEEDYELLTLTGNVSLLDNKPFIHTHVSFSDTKFKAYGGHLFDAKVIAACELLILVSNYKLHRNLNCNIGLSLWDIKE